MKVIKDICYSPIAHERHHLDIYLPDCEEFKVFVYFHGGGITCGDKSDFFALAEYLTSKNIAFVAANYRLYPSASYPEFIKDAAQAVAWTSQNIENYGKCTGIYVGGSSAGAYLSMMLCFDKRYLGMHDIDPDTLAGFIHDAGQPTCHFNTLAERGFDPRRIVVDESAPVYHIGTRITSPPMLFIVSDNDMECRYEQTMMMIATLKHFEYDMGKIDLKIMHGGHCEYIHAADDNNKPVFGEIVYDYISKT